MQLRSLIAGLVAAAITGGIWFLLSGWWDTLTRPSRPQTVVQTTKETPGQIVLAAIVAFMVFAVLAVVVVGVIWFTQFGLRPVR